MAGTAPPLRRTEKLAFGVGQIAEGIKTSVFGTFLLFYYSQVLGLSADLAGLAIALALIFDAVTDPLAGTISDRWSGRLGRRHPFIYASALPMGIAFYLLFAPVVSIDSAGQWGLFAWMLTFTVLVRGAMTLYYVPHMALGAELSSDYDERTTLVAVRHFFGALGFILVFVLGFGYFFAPTEEYANGQTNPAAYPPFMLLLSALVMLAIFATAHGTRHRIPYLPKATLDLAEVGAMDVLREAVDTLRNPSFKWMLIGFIIIIVAFGVTGATGLYMMTFFWELDRYQIMLALLAGPIGSMFGYAVSGTLFSWLDKRAAMMAGAVTWMVIHTSPVLLYLIDLWPEKGSWTSALLLILFSLLAGASIAQMIVGSGTTMADIADEHELLTGRRQEGVFFGASSFAGKCSAALGSYIAGLFLVLIEWPTGTAVRTAADVPQDVLLTLAVISGPVAVLLAIPGLLCMYGYRLNRSRLSEIQAELRTRTRPSIA